MKQEEIRCTINTSLSLASVMNIELHMLSCRDIYEKTKTRCPELTLDDVIEYGRQYYEIVNLNDSYLIKL